MLLRQCIMWVLNLRRNNAGERIRTSEGTKPQDLESCAFDRFATPAYKNQ